MIAVAVCGAGGRIGHDVACAIASEAGMGLVLAVERAGHSAVGGKLCGAPVVDDLGRAGRDCHVAVDFTAPPAASALVKIAAERGLAYVCGSTGLSASDLAALREAAARIPVVYAPNMTLGVAIVNRLIRDAARLLPRHDIEIVEMHHRRKKDAPSGTALRFAETLQSVRQGARRINGRSGMTGERPSDEIAIHALRGGDVVGEHHVIFAGPGERVTITHQAESRAAFVAGVLRSVRFVVGREAGFYSIEDVLGISD